MQWRGLQHQIGSGRSHPARPGEPAPGLPGGVGALRSQTRTSRRVGAG